MNDNAHQLPVSQIGNKSNPKFVILLANPARDPNEYEDFPEYKMGDKYKAEGMQFNVFRQYCDWWDTLLKITDEYNINDSYICSLDYYPYHTQGSKLIPKKDNWDSYSLKRLEENKSILSELKGKGIPVFAYYWGHWLKEIPELKNYPKFYQSKNGWKNTKRKELRNFLDIYFKK